MDENFRLSVVRLALKQHGNVTRQQLLELGLGSEAIQYRVGAHHLHPVYRGVYAVGRPPRTALERASAAVLACGATAALSHLTALALWELRKWPRHFDVIVTQDRRPSGITVHLCTTLLPKDLRTHHGIRVTSPQRTLLDCAPLLSAKALTRTVNDAQINRLLKRPQLDDVLARNPRHPGTKLLKPLVTDAAGLTRSQLEDLFKDLCKRYGFPQPKLNTRVLGYEVDALFEKERVIVELDGWNYHRTRSSFEKDRNRDADTLAAGLPTIRITEQRLVNAPGKEAERLRRILAGRR